jgi:hypothetical protein
MSGDSGIIYSMIEGFLKHKLFICIATVFFFLTFTFNVTGALSTDGFIQNDKYSENFVVRQVRCNGQLYENQLLGLKNWANNNKDLGCDKDNYAPYNSSFGLQGRVGVFLNSILERKTHANSGVSIVVYELLMALASAILFALLALWVKLRFGKRIAVIFSIFVSLSPMLVSFSRNLYWALPLMIAPIVYILYFYKPGLSKRNLTLFMGGLTLLLYLRFLCGYEYITTIAIMVVSVALYKLVLADIKYKTIVKNIILIGLTPVIAMALAFSTHVVSLNQQTGSTTQSIEIIKERAQDRTVNAEAYAKYAYLSLADVANDFYKTSNEYIKYNKIKDNGSVPLAIVVADTAHLLLPVIHTPILGGVFAMYAQSFAMFIVTLLLLYIYRAKWVKREQIKQINSLYAATAVGLIGYFSWLVFAYSHSLVHAFINGILMYLPTALFGFIIIGLYVEFLIKKYINRKR